MQRGIKIELTGNPFVDTGIAVVSSLAGLDDVKQLTLTKLKSVYRDGKQLTGWNSRLKAFTQIFGTNNPLFQPSYGFEKGRGPSETNKKIYKSILHGLLSEIGKGVNGSRCWACGTPSDFDFGEICRRAIEGSGKEAPENKWVGRDWFPLAGSLGSDAQALPAASRPPHICPRCLLAIHYLPLGLMLLDGKLAVFQSTSVEFWYELIHDIATDVRKRIQSGNYATLGSKEGGRAVLERLLSLFERLQREERHGRVAWKAPLYVWRFSNSGSSPECSIIEIPDPAMTFLWDAIREGSRHEIELLINSEGKNRRYSMFQCILDRRDYPNLYPRGRARGASMKLFAFYQVHIRGHSTRALQTAHRLAQEASKSLSEKEFKRLQRREAFGEMKVRNWFRAIIVQMAEKGDLTLDDYLDLFPNREGQGITVEWDGWNLISFYLHHANEDFPNMAREFERTNKVTPCLFYYAAKIYNHFLGRKGKDQFQKEVLAHMGRKIGAPWIRRQFVQLAESEDGFSYGDWSGLCKLENGELFVSELLFQMRILWSKWSKENRRPADVSKPNVEGPTDGLPQHMRTLIETLFTDYVNKHGLDRFQRDVLQRLRREEIGLRWFHEKLTHQISRDVAPLTEEEWEEFLLNDRGGVAISERLFQLHLALANLLRRRATIEDGGISQ